MLSDVADLEVCIASLCTDINGMNIGVSGKSATRVAPFRGAHLSIACCHLRVGDSDVCWFWHVVDDAG